MAVGDPLLNAFSMQAVETTIRRRLRESPLLWRALAFLAIAHLVFHVFWWLPYVAKFTAVGGDTTIYFAAAFGVYRHLQPYSLGYHYSPSHPPITYVYWPQLAILLSPLTSLGHPAFARIWRYILTFAFWVFAWSLAKIVQGRATFPGVCVAGMIIACMPDTYVVLWNGNADPILWALVGVAFATQRTCEWLTVAAQIKTYVITSLCLIVAHEPVTWRRVVPILVVGFLISWIFCPGWIHPWLLAVGPIAHQGSFFGSNISLPMAILRLIRVCGWHYDGGLLPGWAQMILVGSSLTLEVLAVIVSLRIRITYRYPILLLLSGLAQPLCWPCYLTSGLVIVALRLREYSHEPEPTPPLSESLSR